MKKYAVIYIVCLVALLLSACAPEGSPDYSKNYDAGAANSEGWYRRIDEDASYSTTARMPADEKVYEFSGIVGGGNNSYASQTPGYGYGYSYNGYGNVSVVGQSVVEKSVVRLLVKYTTADEIAKGDIVLLKVVDARSVALAEGDEVTLRCRKDYEALSPVMKYEMFSDEKGVWEYDGCRLKGSVVSRVGVSTDE